jgi:histidine triad (HIT) family protein
MTLAQNDPCVLGEMVAGREEASPAYEDEHVIAVMDLSPVTQGHLFVFPRAHVESLEALDADLMSVAMRKSPCVARSKSPFVAS